MTDINLTQVWSLELDGSDGAKHSLESLSQNYDTLVLYFYPKDDTPGCSLENQQFTELKAEFEKHGAMLIGVSPDSVASHEKFCNKYDLKNLLLSDTEKKLAETFGVWAEKSMFGKKYFGITRSTFAIDTKEKTIAHSWTKVNPKDHAREVLNTIVTK